MQKSAEETIREIRKEQEETTARMLKYLNKKSSLTKSVETENRDVAIPKRNKDMIKNLCDIMGN